MSGGLALINFPGNKTIAQYKSRAIVKAIKIIRIQELQTEIQLYFSEPGIGPWRAELEWFANNKPEAGDYLIIPQSPPDILSVGVTSMREEKFLRMFGEVATLQN